MSKNPVDALVGGRLRAIRAAQGLTASELAQRLGWSLATIERHEAGQLHVSAEEIRQYILALRVKVSAVFRGLTEDGDISVPRRVSMAGSPL
jgi:transcriptional regulator with XRE-family HTH domain